MLICRSNPKINAEKLEKSANLRNCVICMISAYKHMILHTYDIFAIKKSKILAHTPFLKKVGKNLCSVSNFWTGTPRTNKNS